MPPGRSTGRTSEKIPGPQQFPGPCVFGTAWGSFALHKPRAQQVLRAAPGSAAVPANSPIPAARGRPRAKPRGPGEASLCQRDRTLPPPALPASPNTRSAYRYQRGAGGEKPPLPASRPAEDSTSPGGARGRAGGHRKEGSVQKGEAGRGWGAADGTRLTARRRSGSSPPRTPAAGSWWGRAQPMASGAAPRPSILSVLSLCPVSCPCPATQCMGPTSSCRRSRRAAGRERSPAPRCAAPAPPRPQRARAAPAAPPQGRETNGPKRQQHESLPPAGAGHSPGAGNRAEPSLLSAIESFKYTR